MSMKKTDEQIREQILELGKQEFEVISLNRKIIDVEVKITDLYAMMSDQEKLLTETKIDNSDLRDKIYKIQGHVQDVWPHDTGDEYTPGSKYNGTDEAPVTRKPLFQCKNIMVYRICLDIMLFSPNFRFPRTQSFLFEG